MGACGFSVSDERCERLRRWFRRSSAQFRNELDACGGERVGHRFLEEQPAETPERGPLEPWFALLGVEHDELERLVEDTVSSLGPRECNPCF